MEWLNFRHLYAFWAVCRYGGFRKASEKLFVSQSTISEQVKSLEEYLDERLLERTTRSVKMTERGAALLERANTIFSVSHTINRVFRDNEDTGGTPHIRVGMVGGISRNFLYGRITRTLDQGFGARVEVVDGSLEDLTRLLRGFELDLLFSLDRPRQQDLVTMSHRRVASSPLCIAGTPEIMASLLAGDASDVELYLFRYPSEGPPLDQFIGDRFDVETSVPVWTDDISLLRFLANSGRGFALVPEIGIREDLASGRVEALTLEAQQAIEIHAIFPTNGARRDLVDAFIQ